MQIRGSEYVLNHFFSFLILMYENKRPSLATLNLGKPEEVQVHKYLLAILNLLLNYRYAGKGNKADCVLTKGF